MVGSVGCNWVKQLISAVDCFTSTTSGLCRGLVTGKLDVGIIMIGIFARWTTSGMFAVCFTWHLQVSTPSPTPQWYNVTPWSGCCNKSERVQTQPRGYQAKSTGLPPGSLLSTYFIPAGISMKRGKPSSGKANNLPLSSNITWFSICFRISGLHPRNTMLAASRSFLDPRHD